jgi:hypothetical protein
MNGNDIIYSLTYICNGTVKYGAICCFLFAENIC